VHDVISAKELPARQIEDVRAESHAHRCHSESLNER